MFNLPAANAAGFFIYVWLKEIADGIKQI